MPMSTCDNMFQRFLILWGIIATHAAESDDLIVGLPGLAKLPNYKMYSGYLDASATKHFHYWFVESQGDPGTDPVVLWLNGGPGCSSLDGLLSENGPLHVNDDGATLYNNPYSWNKIANVLYFESPAGVGYSYDDHDNLKTNDDQVSLHNYNAVVNFFKKFPEFSKNAFYITGESYAGVYVPTLSVRIMKGSYKINFKGMAIGNALSNIALNFNSLVFFAYYHGLFGAVLWNKLTMHCCNGVGTKENCNFYASQDRNCSEAVNETVKYGMELYGALNPYTLYGNCSSPATDGSTEQYRRDVMNYFRFNPRVEQSFSSHRKVKYRPHTSTTAGVGGFLVCINSTAETNWLNRQDVRHALHIPPNLPQWEVCSSTIHYSNIYQDMSAHYHQLMKYDNFQILLYNGDTDMACNFLGEEWFVDGLKRPITRARQPWFVGGQVAGFAKAFDKIRFTTIRGSGHMVPQMAPTYAFAMFEKFINNKPFSN